MPPPESLEKFLAIQAVSYGSQNLSLPTAILDREVTGVLTLPADIGFLVYIDVNEESDKDRASH